MKKELQPAELAQIHRIQGQLRGVEKIISQKAKTAQILQQIEAVRGNLKALERKILGQKTKNLKDSELEQAFSYLLKIIR